MKTNMHFYDSVIRVVIAVGIALFYFTDVITGGWAFALMIVACVLFVTAIAGVCPLYSLLGISSCRRKKMQ